MNMNDEKMFEKSMVETVKKREEKMFEKCIDWLGEDVDRNCITVVYEFDNQDISERIYLAAWNVDEEYTNAYVIRVFTGHCGDKIYLSQDYHRCVETSYFVHIIPEIFNVINKTK